MKLKTIAVLGTLAGAGAYFVSRWRKVEKMEQEKKLITIHTKATNNESTPILEEFPHLTEDFVLAILSQKDTFSQDYPEESTVRIYHQVGFNNVEDLAKFQELLDDLSFDVEVLVENLVLKAAKNLSVTKGLILHEIFSIANLAQRQEGNYQGYSIELL